MTSTMTAQPSSDPNLAVFLDPTFSPTAYLNSILPAWSSTVNTASAVATSQPQNLAVVTRETQDLLTRLNTSLTRLTNTLNTLTNDILRTGGRLAYEVEVLRGDAGSLTEALDGGGLRAEFERLGINGAATAQEEGGEPNGRNDPPIQQKQREQQPVEDKPEFITTLHILTQVRTNLDRVVSVFGQAMEWSVPPPPATVLDTASAKVHIEQDKDDRDAKGKEYAERARDEVGLLLDGDRVGEGEGIQAAIKRVEELRELASVWKGTAEERARMRFVDSLNKMVEDERERREG